jgi:predicted membrane-bound spermidine synthase
MQSSFGAAVVVVVAVVAVVVVAQNSNMLANATKIVHWLAHTVNEYSSATRSTIYVARVVISTRSEYQSMVINIIGDDTNLRLHNRCKLNIACCT